MGPRHVLGLALPVYLLVYDLVEDPTPESYRRLTEELRRLGGHSPLEGTWLVNLPGPPRELRDRILPLMGRRDRLWISGVRGGDFGGTNVAAGTAEWLERNPPG